MTWVPPFTPDPRLFPFTSRWWDADVPAADYRGRVHWIDEGEGPPILFVHGNPTWSFLWRGLVIRLRKRFRCIAIDLPGFGLSQEPEGGEGALRPDDHAEVLGAFLRHLDLKDLVIAGHDWGGPISLRAAADQPERLRGLVMSNTWYWPAEDWHMKAYGYAMSTGPVQKAVLEKNLFVEQIVPRAVQITMAKEVLDHYREALPTPRRRAGAALLPREVLRSRGWLADLAEDVARNLVNVPLLLAWGVNDIAMPVRFMERFREDFRLVRVSRLDGKHYVQEDAPAEMAEAIRAWSEGLAE